MVINVTKENFEQEILNGTQKILVDFWASWCAPCRMLAPVVEEFASEHPQIKVCKINIDEDSELAMKYKVMSIPTLVVFQDGEAVNKSVGVISKEEIEALLA